MSDAGSYLLGLWELEAVPQAIDCENFWKSAEAIFLATVVVYARPFLESNSKGHADAMIRPKKLRLFDGQPEFKALHKLVIDRRNQAAAHADWQFHQAKLIEDGAPTGTLRRAARPHYRRDIEIEAFSDLIQFVHHRVSDALWELDNESKRTEAHSPATLRSSRKGSRS